MKKKNNRSRSTKNRNNENQNKKKNGRREVEELGMRIERVERSDSRAERERERLKGARTKNPGKNKK